MKNKTIKLFLLVLLNITFLSSCMNNFVLVTGGEDKKGYVDAFVTEAKFNYPTEMAVDEKTGDLYVLDTNGIRKITLDGNVSTFLKLEDIQDKKSGYISSFKIRDEYLYFSIESQIKRVKLSNNKEIENFIGKEEKGDSVGKIQDALFKGIVDFDFYPDGNMVIVDYGIIKIVDFKNNSIKIKKIIFNGREYPDKEYSGFLSGITKVNINQLSKKIFCLSSSLIYEEKNDDVFSDTDSYSFISSFSFDNKGQILAVYLGVDDEKIIKRDIKSNFHDITNLNGIAQKVYDFISINFDDLHLTIDKKQNILYLSSVSKNKIYKLKLN